MSTIVTERQHTHTHTHTQTNEQAHGYRRTLADLPKHFKCLTLRKWVKVTECNFRKCQNLQMSRAHFFANSYRLRNKSILNFWQPQNRLRWRSAIFAITQFDGNCQNLQMSPSHFCANSYRLREINIFNFWPCKGQGQGQVEEKRYLPRSIANVWMCIAGFFISFASYNIRKRWNLTYFKHLK